MQNQLSLKALIKNKSWHSFFSSQENKQYWVKLEKLLNQEKQLGKIIYPPDEKIFRCFNDLDFKKIKVVILGQDPYHQKGQANGLAFSVSSYTNLPPSLKNIFKEILSKKELPQNINGDLSKWSQQGVFLLNSILTVRESEPLSHRNFGWEILAAELFKYLDISPKCFLFWGEQALIFKKELQNQKHLILQTSHPSPLSSYRGFLGCNHFNLVNNWLIKNNQKPIQWI